MAPLSAAVIYILVWWLLLFVVLALGKRDPDPENQRVGGAEPSAPARPRLALRLLITTAGAALILAVIYAVVRTGVTLEDIPLPSPPGL